MQKSLMIGITEKDMQAVINTYDLNRTTILPCSP